MKIERLLLIGIIIIISMGLVTIFFPHFRIKNFKETRVLSYSENYNIDVGLICFGNMLQCMDVTIEESGNVDTSVLGNYHVTFVVKHGNNEKKLEQDIIVVDDKKPEIKMSDDVVKVCPNGKILTTIEANDEYEGDLTDRIKTIVNDNKMVVEISDSANNKMSIEKDVLVEDDDSPIIVLNGDKDVYVEKNVSYAELYATATDNCDGDLTDKIVVSGSVDTSKVGNYTITYTVSDQNGNESKVERIVRVYERYKQVYGTGTIYLTFDDGPGPYTEKLLNVLKKYNVKATFFVTDQNLSRGYDNMIKRAYDEGHTIALHTQTHDYSYLYSSVDNYFNDLNAISNKVERITGVKSNIIRFPGGSSNTVSKNYDNGSHIMSKLTKMVTEKGYRYYDWNISSGDAGNTTDTATVAANVINSLGTKSTYVVLQHDVKKYSVDAVETIIQYGLSHGFKFDCITNSTPLIQHGVNN